MPERPVLDATDPGRRARRRRRPRADVVVLAVVTVLVLGAAWLMDSGSEAGDASPVEVAAGDAPAPEVGAPATDFTAVTTEGERFSLSDLAGRPVWISFVSTWCSSCRSEAPDVQAAWEESAGDVAFVSVYLADADEQVSTYAERLGMTYPQVADPQNAIAGQYRVMAVPSHFFIDRHGTVSSTHVGVLTRDQMARALEDVGAAP